LAKSPAGQYRHSAIQPFNHKKGIYPSEIAQNERLFVELTFVWLLLAKTGISVFVN